MRKKLHVSFIMVKPFEISTSKFQNELVLEVANSAQTDEKLEGKLLVQKIRL